MKSFYQIDKSRKILKLGEQATLSEIKSAYRKLSLKYHPDKCKEPEKNNCEKQFVKIKRAYDILMDYCVSYEYSFKEGDIQEIDIDKEFKEHIRRFYDWF